MQGTLEALSLQGASLVFFGIIICFMGYSLFKSMLPLWGFIIIGILALTLLPVFVDLKGSQLLIAQIITFFVAGVIGALIANPLYYVIVFVTGASLGALVGTVVGAYIDLSGGAVSFQALTALAELSFPPAVDTPGKFMIVAILALVTGVFAIGFQKFMITAATAFMGATAVVSGMNTTLLGLFTGIENRSVLVGLVWMFIGMLGLFIQYRMRDET